MNFNSIEFLIFLPIVILGYFLLPHKFRWVWLLAASYFFYMSWNPWLSFLIVGTTLISYLGGVFIEKTEDKRVKKFWLIATLAVCLGVLFFFKYFDFMLDSVCEVIRLFVPKMESPALNLILPIGISFYTFQTLSYVIDVYRGQLKAEKHFGYYALFVSFFPQLVAGPIERPGDLIPQLRAERQWDWTNFEEGFRILLGGFFRKCVIADSLAVFVDSVFANLQEANSLALILAGLLFLVQMYNDFAGYSEIAAGAARILGIKLSKNFNQPLLSRSFREFFRRWHITLNTWFTDYVYIPLGGNRKGKVRQIINMAIVFTLCGLWHGANWTYVVWGGLMAIFISVETICAKPIARWAEKYKIDLDGQTAQFFQRAGLFLLIIPSSLIFRSANLSEAWICISSLFTKVGIGTEMIEQALETLSMNGYQILLVTVFMVILYYLGSFSTDRILPISADLKENALVRDEQWGSSNCLMSYFHGVLAVILSWLILLANSDLSAFAYFQF